MHLKDAVIAHFKIQ